MIQTVLAQPTAPADVLRSDRLAKQNRCQRCWGKLTQFAACAPCNQQWALVLKTEN